MVRIQLVRKKEIYIQEGGFLAAFIDFSKAYERVCRKKLGVFEGVRCEWEVLSNDTGIVP